jgi:hypothetical protein
MIMCAYVPVCTRAYACICVYLPVCVRVHVCGFFVC